MVIILLVGILFTAFGVVAWLFYQAHAASLMAQESLAVPVESLEEVRSLRGTGDHLIQHQAAEQAAAGISPERRVSMTAVVQNEEQVQHWRAENAAFHARIQESSTEILQLKDSVSRLDDENRRLKVESEDLVGTRGLVQEAKREYQHRLEGFFKEIEELNEDNRRLNDQAASGAEAQRLRREADELLARARELEIVNAALSEKNEYLQYELTKSRAQVVGLERLCERTPVGG